MRIGWLAKKSTAWAATAAIPQSILRPNLCRIFGKYLTYLDQTSTLPAGFKHKTKGVTTYEKAPPRT
jgi:hypothetical protein